MDLKTALRQGTELLEKGSIASPRLTAEVLLCHALGCGRSYLYAHPERELSHNERLHFGRHLYERLTGKPTQYITRRQEFYGREFRVTPEVFIPRPETEHVVETALRVAPNARSILDVGCGAGAIAATLQLETRAAVWATDISLPALAVAAENCHRLDAVVRLVACDVASAFRPASFDLMASNPPYIPDTEQPNLQREVRFFEPPIALFGGPTGVEIYARLVADARRVLRPEGWLVVELGYRTQEQIRALLDDDWKDVDVTPDLAGWPRVLSARYSP